ncbi:hypothetical protein Angca_009657, partial [Angiostrongylus cantonensis]
GGATRTPHIAIDLGTTANVDNLGFYDSGEFDLGTSTPQQHKYADYGCRKCELKGLGHGTGSSTMPSGSIPAYVRSKAQMGAAGRLLESRGFGWLLEVDDNCDTQTPLLLRYWPCAIIKFLVKFKFLSLHEVHEGVYSTNVSKSSSSSSNATTRRRTTVGHRRGSSAQEYSKMTWSSVAEVQCSFSIEIGSVLGVVGYCLIPLVVTGLLMSVVAKFKIISLPLGIFGVIWSVYSAGTLLCVDELQSKKPLLLYPVFLLYVYFFSLYSGV